jgi:hypothetical protein
MPNGKPKTLRAGAPAKHVNLAAPLKPLKPICNDLPDSDDCPATDRATLTDRANGLCVTLSQCEELLEAIGSRVTGCPAVAGAGVPSDDSLSGAVDAAAVRADTLLANLRHLAGEI